METKTGYRAISKYLMGSPFKIRPVADLLLRGYVGVGKYAPQGCEADT